MKIIKLLMKKIKPKKVLLYTLWKKDKRYDPYYVGDTGEYITWGRTKDEGFVCANYKSAKIIQDRVVTLFGIKLQITRHYVDSNRVSNNVIRTKI